MKLRLIEGGAGSGKSRLCLTELAARQKEQPVGPPLLLLVPEQATFGSERAFVGFVGASLRAQAVSFSGLYRLLATEQTFAALPWLDEQGRAMLLEACLQQNRGQLEVLDAAAGNVSFVDALARALVEFEQYSVAPADLRRAAEKLPAGGRLLAGKLRDLARLYEAYLRMVVGGFRDQGLMMAELAQAAAASRLLQDAELWLDNFLDFNPSQLAVLRALFPKLRAVNLCLCLPPGAAENPGLGRIFGGQLRLRKQFLQLAAQLGAEVEVTRLTANWRQQLNPELAAVEACFAYGCFAARMQPGRDWPALAAEPPVKIELLAAPDAAAEAAYAAQTIVRLCREQGYLFRDIAVITRNLATYRTELENTFRDFGIPYFFDMGAELGRHPLVKLISTVLSVLAENWSTPAVLAYLKSGLAPLSLEEADRLENYALRCGLKSYMWRQAGKFKRTAGYFSAAELAEINVLAERALSPLLQLWEGLRGAQPELTVGRLAEALQELLQTLQVAESLLAWEQAAIQRQELRLADGHRQILPKVEQLLAQLAAFLGQMPVSFAQFAELWQEGTARLQLSSIPPSGNEVNVAEISRSRLPEIKAAIVLGLNEGELPAVLAEDGLLGSADREALAGLGIELAAGPRERQENEEYLAYIALTRSSELLFLSYSERAADGAELRPSTALTRLQQIFPKLEVKRPADLSLPDNLGGDRHLLAGLAAHLAGLRDAPGAPSAQIEQNGQNAQGVDLVDANASDVDAFWRSVCQSLTEQGRLQPELAALRQGLAYRVDRAPLDRRRFQALYGSGGLRSTSVSRLERFNNCPCRYYATYGLGLEPRAEFKLQTADIGSLYHYILSEVMQQLAAADCDWAALTAAELEPLVRQTMQEFAARGLADILADSGKNSYMAEKMLAVVTQSLLDMAANLAAGSFRPLRFELKFGLDKDGLQPLELELADGRRISLRGMIDRVDAAQGSDAAFVRIIDYKMQNKTLRLADIYYGLNWQLPLYLEALLRNVKDGRQLRPAGMFYVPVQEIVKNVRSLAEEGAAVKLQGLAVLDTEALLLAERGLEPGAHAKTMHVQWKKDSSFGPHTLGLSPQEYAFMQDCLQKQAAECLGRLQAGEIRQRPLEQNGRLICEYCDFYTVCAVDLAVERDSRPVENLSQAEVLQRWRRQYPQAEQE